MNFIEKKLYVNEAEVRQPRSPPVIDVDRGDSKGNEDNEDSDENEEGEDSADGQGAVPSSVATGSRRLRLRYIYCMNCKEEFDVPQNTWKSCCYHSELPEPNAEIWPDYDGPCVGPIYTESNLEIYQQGFLYPCCDRHGDKKPCVTDWHREHPEDREALKRRRMY